MKLLFIFILEIHESLNIFIENYPNLKKEKEESQRSESNERRVEEVKDYEKESKFL